MISGVASFSLATNTFSSTYDNYLILMQCTATGNYTFSWRGRTSGTDNTNSNYDWRTFFNDASGGGFNVGANNQTSGSFSDSGSSRSTHTLEIYNPFASQPTQIFARNYINDGNGYVKYGGSQFDATTSFDSLTIFPSTGTITGSYSVFGYNK